MAPTRAQGAHGEALPNGAGDWDAAAEFVLRGQAIELAWIIIASTSEPEPAGEMTGVEMQNANPPAKHPAVRPKKMAKP